MQAAPDKPPPPCPQERGPSPEQQSGAPCRAPPRPEDKSQQRPEDKTQQPPEGKSQRRAAALLVRYEPAAEASLLQFHTREYVQALARPESHSAEQVCAAARLLFRLRFQSWLRLPAPPAGPRLLCKCPATPTRTRH